MRPCGPLESPAHWSGEEATFNAKGVVTYGPGLKGVHKVLGGASVVARVSVRVYFCYVLLRLCCTVPSCSVGSRPCPSFPIMPLDSSTARNRHKPHLCPPLNEKRRRRVRRQLTRRERHTRTKAQSKKRGDEQGTKKKVR